MKETRLQPLQIGKHTLKHPIIQGGMGVGISWDRLASSVSRAGGLGVISCVGTGYYKNGCFADLNTQGRPKGVENFYSKEALFEIYKNARKQCGDAPLGGNVLYAINDFGRVLRNTCEAGANIVIVGAGLPTNLPEFTVDFPDVALVPIVSSAKALKIIAKRWEQRYKRIPDAIIVEGPLSGGHQGLKYEQCFDEDFQLEKIVPQVVEEAKKIGNIPTIAAGGIWNRDDIYRFLDLGASGVQMATRFLGTYECDAINAYKDLLLHAKKEDIELIKSPVGYPARAIRTNLARLVEQREGPDVRCVSSCVFPCENGKEAREVGYCIADRLADGAKGKQDVGLFFSGSNGYRIDEILHVDDLMEKLVYGE